MFSITNYFSLPKADQKFCLFDNNLSEGKCSQSTPAIAEAELACGKGTVTLFEIRICKGVKDNNYKFCSNYYYKNYHCDVR